MNFVVSDWKDAWKWLSVQFSALMIIWASLPLETQTGILALFGLNQSHLMGIMGLAIIVGRLVKQGGASSAPKAASDA